MEGIKCGCGKNDGECTYETEKSNGFSLTITDVYYLYCHSKKNYWEIGKETAADYTNDDSTYCPECGKDMTSHRKLKDILKENKKFSFSNSVRNPSAKKT